MTPAHASLLGDTAHVTITTDVIVCDEDVVVIDPGVEIPDCGGAMIDLDADKIWFKLPDEVNGFLVVEILYEFTDLDWTGVPGGMIIDVQVIPDTFFFPVQSVVFDDHSITMITDSFIVDCQGAQSCTPSVHLDITASHPVGGESLSIDSSALILAGAQSFSWMIPVVLSVLGIGLFVVSRKSE